MNEFLTWLLVICKSVGEMLGFLHDDEWWIVVDGGHRSGLS